MRLPTDIKRLCLLTAAFFMASTNAGAQLVQTNPADIVAIEGGHELVYGSVKDQTKKLEKVAALQGAMSAEFTQIKSWEKKYNAYLKSARGYAETMKAGTTLYLDGMRTFQNLMQVQKAVSANPEGIAATLSMNNLYVETGTELLKTYNLLKNEVAGEGTEHMLNGAERNDMLWNLSDQLQSFNKKLHELAVSIAYYNMLDVWKKATAGMIDIDKERIANDALDRWKRAQKVSQVISQ